MQVSPHVRAVQVPTDNPMNPQFTTIYLVGDNQSLTIDSGEALEKYRWMLRGYLAAVERTEIAIAAITHHHADHSGNLKWVRENYGADVAIPPNARPLLKGRLPAKGVTWPPVCAPDERTRMELALPSTSRRPYPSIAGPATERTAMDALAWGG